MFETIKENNKYKNLVNGSWIHSETNEYIEIKSVLDNSTVGFVPSMSQKEVDFVLENAKTAQKKWRETSLDERANILYKVANILEKNVGIFVESMIHEIGKDKKSCKSEVFRTADFIRYTADTIRTLTSECLTGDGFYGGSPKKTGIIKREPLGVVLAISPFNYPINLSASKIAPAIAIGNSVVLKPSTQGSICGLHLVRIFEEAGVPKGVIQTVTGKGSEIGDYIVSHKNIDFINFTGSTDIGKRITSKCGMIPVILELGGKDAGIVLEDADLDHSASQIMSGAFSYSGQRCTAIKRVLVMEQVYDTLIDKLLERVKDITVGNPLNGDFDVVPLINEKSADFVMGLIDDAKQKGATILCGDKREGNLIYPTIIKDITLDMDVAWEEPFGPVLPIIKVKSYEEAIEIANKSEYGLQSSIFTKDINKAFSIADKLEVGSVQINNKTERGPDSFPFLGVKASGIGVQGVRYSIEAMSRPKVTVINI
ncbi:NADP-dependent glyceraldehyde-3-phosphate dehydrogenase [[Clostridium] colinum]|uniref:NADP-dependent glyceraldehyde-3-phosphate dehydrogenase n=1 Tax=[Clostridium] colinum TaxID=36835 RepID=UPI0020255A7B|nr:NADP-dependent glyceraldehyde-3-phosphate dehydrogenase [[Clostridium] colinum]